MVPRLFLDEPRIVWQAQRDLLRENLRLFRQLSVPMLISAPLMALVLWRADAVYSRGPLPKGEAVVVTAHIPNGNLAGARLQAPPEIVIETPAVRAPQSREVSWRIRPSQPFSGHLAVSGSDARVDVPWPRAAIFGLPWMVWFFGISAFFALIRFPRSALALLLVAVSGNAAEKTSLILISVDTLRADHLGAYGYKKISTPAIDAVGTVYEHIDAQIPLTLPSHTVLMTSTYPFQNGVEANDEAVPRDAVTLASVLRANGFRTAAFIGSMILDKRYGLDKGFELYDSPFASTRVRRDAALVTRAARQWIDKNKTGPIFAFIHLYDLHTPYTAVPGLTPTVAGYDAELQYIDQTIGRLRDALIADGIWDKCLVLLTADHGESLGDHGETSHGFFIYESTMHVPLIVHWPNPGPAHPPRSDESGGIIDIAPTILDFLHIPQPPSFAGISLLSSHDREVYGESLYPQENFGWAPLRSLRQAQLKSIEAPRAELYDLFKDPGERTNLIGAHADQAKSLQAKLNALRAKYPAAQKQSATEISSQTRAVLGSLGYTSGGHRNAQPQPADPKDKIGIQEAYESGLTLLYSGHYDQARLVFQKISRQDPKNTAAINAAGESWLRSGNATQALAAWQHSLELDPKNRSAAESIGAYWLARGDTTKACGFVPDAPQCKAGGKTK